MTDSATPPPSEPGGGPSEPPTPTSPPPGDDRVAVLAAYLRANEGRFTDEALARAARDAGYSEAEIAAAHALAGPSWQAPEAPYPQTRRTDRRVVAAVAIGYVVGLYFLVSTTASMSSNLSGSAGLVGLLGGVIAWFLLRDERPSLAQGIGCGVILAVTIPIVAILVILGICLVAGGGRIGG